jgi:hypothetical protein
MVSIMYGSGIDLDKVTNISTLLLCELFISTISYSLCLDNANHVLPGYHLSEVQDYLSSFYKVNDTSMKEEDQNKNVSNALATPITSSLPFYLSYKAGQDDLKLFSALLYFLTELLLLTRKGSNLLNALLRSLLGKSTSGYRETTKLPELYSRSWLKLQLPPFLLLPLFDVNVLVAGLSNISFHLDHANPDFASFVMRTATSETDTGCSVENMIPWICIGKFMQLFLVSSSSDEINHSSLQETTTSGDVNFSSNNYSILSKFISLMQNMIQKHHSFPVYFANEQLIGKNLLQWMSFIRSIIHCYCRQSSSQLNPNDNNHNNYNIFSSSSRNKCTNNYLSHILSNHRKLEAFVNPIQKVEEINNDILTLYLQCVGLDWLTKGIMEKKNEHLLLSLMDNWLTDYYSYLEIFESQKNNYLTSRSTRNEEGKSEQEEEEDEEEQEEKTEVGRMEEGEASTRTPSTSNTSPPSGSGSSRIFPALNQAISAMINRAIANRGNAILNSGSNTSANNSARSSNNNSTRTAENANGILSSGSNFRSINTPLADLCPPPPPLMSIDENLPFHYQLPEKLYYPCLSSVRPSLIALPDDYSKLHAMVASKGSYDYPALCLLCGAVLNASGKGQCHAHVYSCNAGMGIFFLIQVRNFVILFILFVSYIICLSFQDCHVLLCHGPRSTYFPSPYVDVYGEIHSQYRGKPLHLDKVRYQALEQLWLGSQIPTEVMRSRSNLNRVIINGYY